VNRVGLAARAALAAASLAFWGGCGATPHPPNPRLTTLFDVQALYAGGATPDFAIATDAGLPGGVPIGHLADANGTLAVDPAWAESYSVAYVTTEVWTSYDEVWLQPMYVPITGFAGGAPQIVKDASGAWQPLFGVGAGSGFYSPFWQTIYFQVPAGTPADAVTSVRAVAGGGYPLFPGPGLAAPLTPAGESIPDPTKAGGDVPGTGWVDGAPAPFISFPAIPFSWNEDDVIAEVPLYHFVYRKDDGSLAPLPIPTVVGTGPPYSHTPAPPLVNNKLSPKYSAYWRLYTVVVPASAVVFAPPDDLVYYPQLVALGQRTLPAAAYPLPEPDAIGRVALDGTCFAVDPDPHDPACVYLDSQEHIEANIDAGDIERTSVTVTCPLVSVNGTPVVAP
jgi:hypothetical protein